MNVDVSMRPENQFEVAHWWAKSPDFVVEALEKQLKAVAAIWPDLAQYRLVKHSAADDFVEIVAKAKANSP